MKKALFIIFMALVVCSAISGRDAYALDLTTPGPSGAAEPPDSFDSAVMNVLDLGITPVEYDFIFTDGQPAYCYYLYDVATSSGETVRVEREYLLTYCKQTCLSGEPVFITGSYSETSTGAVEGFMAGHVEGEFLLFDESAPDPSLVGKTFIALTHIPDSFEGVQAPEQLVYTVVFLEPYNWFPGGTPTPQVSALPSNTPTATPRITPTPNSGGGLFASTEPTSSNHTDYPYSGGSEEDHHHSSGSGSSSARSARHSSSSDMPETSGPVQVAVGAIFISTIAALSNLPTVTLGSGMGAFASSADVSAAGSYAASTSFHGAAQSSSSTSSSPGGGSASVGTEDVSKPSGGVSEIISAIGDFFKQLIANLRDMLTDEGRSYASGKVSDIFEDEK